MKQINLTVKVSQEDAILNTGSRKWRKGHRLRLGCFQVEATSLAAAKEALTTALETLMNADQPVFLSIGLHTAVVVSAVGQLGVIWGHRIIGPEPTRPVDFGCTTAGYDTRAEAIRAATSHLVQNATDYHDDASIQASIDWLDTHRHLWEQRGSVDHLDDLIATQLQYAGFQRAFKEAERRGVSDLDQHRWCVEHGREFTPDLKPTPKAA